MRRILQSTNRGATAWTLATFAGGLAVMMGAASYPVFAQTSSPEIVAKERSDPASGEVVVINRKKPKGVAPSPYAASPYAPIKLKPLPETLPKAKKPVDKPVKKAAPKLPTPKLVTLNPAERQTTVAPRTARAPIPTPPLPVINTERRSASARLKQFPQAGFNPAPERRTERLNEAEPQRRVIRRRFRERPIRRYRERRRYSVRNRPRRLCRRLARRCRDGFDGSCYVWERRCT